MKITKYVHSCLLVETEENTALFDPGMMSETALQGDSLQKLDDIFITHIHGDHVSVPLLKQFISKFPNVRITSTEEVVDMLRKEGIEASTQPPQVARIFQSPHEDVFPMYQNPDEIGVHYVESLSHPGDSHSFKETMPILALPITGPWGSTVRAMKLVLELNPKHVIPIHDWHWNDAARDQTYDHFEKFLSERKIIFHKMQTGLPVEIEV